MSHDLPSITFIFTKCSRYRFAELELRIGDYISIWVTMPCKTQTMAGLKVKLQLTRSRLDLRFNMRLVQDSARQSSTKTQIEIAAQNAKTKFCFWKTGSSLCNGLFSGKLY